MHAYRLRILVKGVFCAAIAVSLLAGCSDNPEDKAAKEIGRITDEAMELARKGAALDDATGEVLTVEVYAQARERLNVALSKASTAGAEAGGQAYLAGGDLNFAQVRCLRKELDDHTVPVSKKIDELSVMARKIASVQLQQERLEQVAADTEAEIVKLTELIEGADEQKGLKAELAAAQAELGQLESEKAQWVSKQQEVQAEASRIQQTADEKKQAAELATGEEKKKLQDAAFVLMLSRRDPLVAAQDAEDHVAILQSKINTVAPTVAQLRDDIDRISTQIDDTANSPEREQVRIQTEEVKAQIGKHNDKVNELVTDMKTAVQTYGEKVGEIASLLEAAVADYNRVRSRSLTQAAKTRIADANFWKASVGAAEVAFRQHIGLRLDAIVSAAEGQMATIVGEAAEQCSQVDEETSKAIMDAYDQAIAEYSQAPQGDADVLGNHALALYGKMAFAERLGDYNAADAALNKAHELLKKVKEENPAFVASVTARLLSGSNEFIPPMAVDMTAQYEEIRKQLQSWKTLRGDEAKVRVGELLAMLNNMKPPMDPSEFGPERKAMEAAMERGFDQVDFSTSDPNSFY